MADLYGQCNTRVHLYPKVAVERIMRTKSGRVVFETDNNFGGHMQSNDIFVIDWTEKPPQR